MYLEEILNAGSVGDNFSNSDNNNCPQTQSFTGPEFSSFTSTQNIVMGFNDDNDMIIDSTHFDGINYSGMI